MSMKNFIVLILATATPLSSALLIGPDIYRFNGVITDVTDDSGMITGLPSENTGSTLDSRYRSQ